MLSYATGVMLSYVTGVMLSYVTGVMLSYVTGVMSSYVTGVMSSYVTGVMLSYVTGVMLSNKMHFFKFNVSILISKCTYKEEKVRFCSTVKTHRSQNTRYMRWQKTTVFNVS